MRYKMRAIEFDCGAAGPQGQACTRPVTVSTPHTGPHRCAGFEWPRERPPRAFTAAECATLGLSLARGAWLAAHSAALAPAPRGGKIATLKGLAGVAHGPGTQLALGAFVDAHLASTPVTPVTPVTTVTTVTTVTPVTPVAPAPVTARRLSVAERARLSNAEARGVAQDPAIAAQRALARGSAQTARQVARTAAADAARRTTAALDGAIQIALASGDGTYPHGLLAAWRPTGEQKWAAVASAAGVAGVAPPAQRSDRAIASEAVALLAGNGLRVATLARGRKWSVYRPASRAEVGGSVGEARLVAELAGEGLVIEGPADLAGTVREAFARARAEATLGSTEISTWLSGLLAGVRAVPTVYGRWVAPGAPAEMWCRLAGALAGAGLPVPAKPAAVASRADVAEEIAAGLKAEVTAQVTAIQTRAVTTARGAVTALGEIDDLRGKIQLYEVLAGPLPAELATLRALAETIRPLVSDTAGRAALLEVDAAPLASEGERLAPCQTTR